MLNNRPASRTPGSGRSSIAFVALKIVVTAPVPSATTSMTTMLNTGLFRSMRPA